MATYIERRYEIGTVEWDGSGGFGSMFEFPEPFGTVLSLTMMVVAGDRIEGPSHLWVYLGWTLIDDLWRTITPIGGSSPYLVLHEGSKSSSGRFFGPFPDRVGLGFFMRHGAEMNSLTGAGRWNDVVVAIGFQTT